MDKNHIHKPSTERATAISLPSDGVAAETRSCSIRRASEGIATKRGAVSNGGRLPACALVSMPKAYHHFFYNIVAQQYNGFRGCEI